MYSKRVMELHKGLKAFGKSHYNKSEILPELLKLQKEIVELTFNKKDVNTSDLRLFDVVRYLQTLNEKRGHVADEELESFKKGCKVVYSMIHSETSGNKGENLAFKNLERVKGKSAILRNVGLSEGQIRANLDAVVINSAGVTIVEINNANKDIHIDEKGECYSTGEFLRLDCNMAEKMSVKEKLLANIIGLVEGEEVCIQSIVVFTNSHIEVHNKCKQVKTCFVNKLNQAIDNFQSGRSLSNEAMRQVITAVVDAMNEECYPTDFDVMKFKTDFATVMAILEEADANGMEEN